MITLNQTNIVWLMNVGHVTQESDFVYTVSDGQATITDYVGPGGEVYIPSTLGGYPTTVIGFEAFANTATIASVTIPNSVISMEGGYAFTNCTALTSVTLGNGILGPGMWAFAYCTALTSVTIPYGINHIDYAAFYGCSALTSIVLPSSINFMPELAFAHCTDLTSITFKGLVAPTNVYSSWIEGDSSALRGHASSRSNFPLPGEIWNGLMMGDFAPEGYRVTQFTRYGSSPVIETGSAGSWDSSDVAVDSVLIEAGVYHLYYTGSSDGQTWNIGHATSSDGIHWVKDEFNPVMTNAMNFHVINEDSLFKAWYTDLSSFPYSVRYATSNNGHNWAQGWEGPVLSVASSGWDSLSLNAGPVIHNSSGYSMWYAGTSDGVTWSVGLATSQNGAVWTRYVGNPVLENDPLVDWRSQRVFALTVLEEQTELVMWFMGVDLQTQRVGVASSTDGIMWVPSVSPVLDVGSPGGWDSASLSFSSVLPMGDGLWMWYSGADASYRYQIGLAVSNISIPPSIPPSLSALYPTPYSTLDHAPAIISVALSHGTPALEITEVTITLDGMSLNVTVFNETASCIPPSDIGNGQHTVVATITANGSQYSIQWTFNVNIGGAPPGFTWHESAKGYSILVPDGWTVLDDASVGEGHADTVIWGPTADGVQTNVLVLTGKDASIVDSQTYLSHQVQDAIASLSDEGMNPVLSGSPQYLKISNRSAVIFGVDATYSGVAMHQMAAVIIDAEHSHYWVVTCTEGTNARAQFDTIFDTIINDFTITSVPGSSEMDMFLIVGIAIVVGVILVAIVFIAVRRGNRTKAAFPPVGPSQGNSFGQSGGISGQPGYPGQTPQPQYWNDQSQNKGDQNQPSAGWSTPPSAPQQSLGFCPWCGARTTGSQFCGYCGRELKGTPPSP